MGESESTGSVIEHAFSALNYLDEIERLSRKPPVEINEHKGYRLDEEQIIGLPGINTNQLDGEAELWLQVMRLHPERPPLPDALLTPWCIPNNSPEKTPELKAEIVLEELSLWPEATERLIEEQKRSDGLVHLKITDCPEIQDAYDSYIQNEWSVWAEEERPRRRTIKIYDRLFALYQEIETTGSEKPQEIVWGLGVGQWRTNGQRIQYPIITKLVEIELDSKTMSLNLRPTNSDPWLELGVYFALENAGAATTEEYAKGVFGSASTSFSPFDSATFDPILRSAVANLDPNGTYFPEVASDTGDRSLPVVAENLVVTDTWVVFSRPRSTNYLAEDIKRLRLQIETTGGVVGASVTVLAGPTDEMVKRRSICFRGVSMPAGSSGIAGGASASASNGEPLGELYFPKPFNEEQVTIIERLEQADGVVVQGPPGTGKTHTIANIICHYLAMGKRVLVTSKGEPALAVLRDQIPEKLQPLVISLLTNEREGLKQLEQSVNQIAMEVSDLSEDQLKKEIAVLKGRIDELYSEIGNIDVGINTWAEMQTQPVPHMPEVKPAELASQVVAELPRFTWFPDELDAREEHAPPMTSEDVDSLREARLTLSQDLIHVGHVIPKADEFPIAEDIVRIHQELMNLQALTRKIHSEDDGIPLLARIDLDTLKEAEVVLKIAESIAPLVKSCEETAWLGAVRTTYLQESESGDEGGEGVASLLDVWTEEVEKAEKLRQEQLGAAIEFPQSGEENPELEKAIRRAVAGKNPFSWFGGDKEAKNILQNIKVDGALPTGKDAWQKVGLHLDLLLEIRRLSARWNGLSGEICAPSVPATGVPTLKVHLENSRRIRNVKMLVAEYEKTFGARVQKVIPRGLQYKILTHESAEVSRLIKILSVHIQTNSLKAAEKEKDSLLDRLRLYSGPAKDELKYFIEKDLGNPTISNEVVMEKWRSLMKELQRLAGISGDLKEVDRVTSIIRNAGATNWAEMLLTVVPGVGDEILPGDWLEAWQWARSRGYLQAIDGRGEHKEYIKRRAKTEADLSKTNLRLIEVLTWLRLKQKLSPGISAALQGYLAAIRRLGKGTGIRANRFRRDAREQMSKANRAVPCWIMPHWRVSESLPAELGSFDLVIIDEASQSDMLALPSIMRSKKLLVVGDDKQVSPSDVGVKESDIAILKHKYLKEIPFGHLLLPGSSIYDLARTVFAADAVVLREHFRCVEPIIQFSNKEFYNKQIRPLRIPKASERIDPPLVGVFVPGGCREGKKKLNRLEAQAIVDEIQCLVNAPDFDGRSIGVVSLLGNEQAAYIQERLIATIGEEKILRHKIRCGDAMTFQGKEADVVMLSLVTDAESVRTMSGQIYEQRINVAASRARDRLYVYHSFSRDQLKPNDLRARLLDHLASPMVQDQREITDLRTLCESGFERSVFDQLVQRGYKVIPQVPVGQYRIDLVVEGAEDRRLAIELDGDQYHTPDKWHDDMSRQRVLERMGWRFWRCWGSNYTIDEEGCLADLIETLTERGVEPVGGAMLPVRSITEFRTYTPSMNNDSEEVETLDNLIEDAPVNSESDNKSLS